MVISVCCQLNLIALQNRQDILYFSQLKNYKNINIHSIC